MKQRDFIWNTIGTSLNTFSSLFFLIIVTRINGIFDAGLFSFAFSISLVLYSIGLFGGRTFQVSDVKNEFSSGDYIVLKFVTTVAMFIIACILILVNQYDLTRSVLVIALVLFRASEAVSDALFGVLQKNGRLYQAGISFTVKATVGITSFLVIDILTQNMMLATFFLFFVNLAVMAIYEFSKIFSIEKDIIRLSQLKTIIRNSRKIITKSTSVFLISFLMLGIANVTRILMDRFHPDLQGYFGIIVMPAMLVGLFVSFLIQPSIVDLAERHHAYQYNAISKILLKIILISLAFGLVVLAGTYLFGAEILTLIYGVDLIPYRLDLCLVIVGGIFSMLAGIFSTMLTIIRRMKSQIIVYLISVVLSVFVSVVLIDTYGIIGGVLTNVITNMILFALLILDYLKNLKSVTFD